MKREMRAVLLAWSLSCIDFLGSSVLDMVVDEVHKEQIMAIMCTLGYKSLSITSPPENLIRRPSDSPRTDNARTNAQMCLCRAQKMITRHNSRVVQHFYTDMVDAARRAIGQIAQDATGENTPRQTGTNE